jgi:hypothetical protein
MEERIKTEYRWVASQDLRVREEVRYIQRRAIQADSRVVSLGHIILFSTETRDAWLLDPADGLAARVARDGVPEAIYIEETETQFAIRWKGEYEIDGDAFIYTDWETARIVTILGYPVRSIAQLKR